MMNALWLWMFPELRRAESERERVALRSAAIRSREYTLAALALCGGFLVVEIVLLGWCKLWAVSHPFFVSLVVIMPSGLIVSLGPLLIVRSRARRRLRRELYARGIPICVACGYDLRGQTESRCPECGAQFTPVTGKDSKKPPTRA